MLPSTQALKALRRLFIALCLTYVFSLAVTAQSGLALYKQIKAFGLSGAKADVTSLVLKRDRAEMTFTGTFYFSAPIDGKVTGAVFIGQGTFHAQVPPDTFEKANLKRLVGVEDGVTSDFKTAVFRFSDNTFDIIGKTLSEGVAPVQAQDFASEIDARILKETGANLSSRVALSILNQELPGFFFANFDGGKRGRFSYLFDSQSRIPTDYFELNAGERGLLFKYQSDTNSNDIWMAFYALSDYARGAATYSDRNDLVDISNYDMNIDLRTPKKRLGLQTKISMASRIPNLRAVTFKIGENLGEYDKERLKKQMRLKTAQLGSQALESIQEDWESGFTVFFANAMNEGQSFDLDLDLDGDFLRQPDSLPDCSYPLSNGSWYPRQGYLDRSTFSFTFSHPKRLKVASTGLRISEQPDPTDKDIVVTKYVMTYPVPLETFALGPFERHADSIKWENGDKPTPLEFDSMPGGLMAIKEDFILAELSNAVRYFQALFGKYPYDSYGAVFHPYGFGQGFASMLTIPNTDRSNKWTYSFIAHETAHQWWGNIVSWRSYRDQWLSEGFAEYSGVLYTGFRDKSKSSSQLIDEMRRSLKEPPQTQVGPGKGKLVDVGPLILGQRLETKKTYGAYTTLVYNKGALVLRMIHFLMTNPSNGDGKPFFDMMKDFVERYRNKVASTDDFRMVANEHFAKTPIAMKYGLKDLNWFFLQWVYETSLPSYHLNYKVENQSDGTAIVTGTVDQENVPEGWFMPLPVLFRFGGNKIAYGTVAAHGPSNAFQIKLPAKPESMELDPQKWVLSEKSWTN